MMVNKRIVIGSIILILGCFAWLGTLYENTPSLDESEPQLYDPIPIQQALGLDVILEMVVDSVIIGIGAVILVWGIRSSQSPSS